MNRRLFGTDGIRGIAGTAPIEPATLCRIAQSAGRLHKGASAAPRVVVGSDTRSSCCMIEAALVAGFTSVGMDVELAGTVPTAAVGMPTRARRADLGVMISASHNPHGDNGIKFFGHDGFKLDDAAELAIEQGLLVGPASTLAPTPAPARFGQTSRLRNADDRYLETVRRNVPAGLSLAGLRIVIDAANGAAFRVAPRLVRQMGAEVIEVGTSPDGVNINLGCGSTSLDACRSAVLDHGADLGIALDGDADRVHLIDEQGRTVDGDQLLALIADGAIQDQSLRNAAIVSTVMSNAGLERHLSSRRVGLVRTDVGDRHVVEKMRELGCNVGGEQSGHIILLDYTTTGDGLIAALRALSAIVASGRPASETLNRFTPLPQVRRNIRIESLARPLDRPEVQTAIADVRAALGSTGRIVVRASGTEPLIRVMLEGDDEARLHILTEELCSTIARPARLRPDHQTHQDT